jgi:hypothetical protein
MEEEWARKKPRYRQGCGPEGGRGLALLFQDLGDRSGVSGQQHALVAFYPRGKTRYPLYRRLDGPQGRSGQAENLAPPGFDPRTVVCRYTDFFVV